MLSRRSLTEHRLAEGFAQVSEPVDRDIRILADQIGQLTQRYERDLGLVMRDLGILAGRIGDFAETTGFNPRVVAKLALDQSELGERLRSLQSTSLPQYRKQSGHRRPSSSLPRIRCLNA